MSIYLPMIITKIIYKNFISPSFMAAREYLEKRGANVRTMSFFSHPISKATPDYIFQKNIDYKPVFPWDKLKSYARTKSP